MIDSMAFLYRKDRYLEVWGKDWIGPDVLPHGDLVLVARFPKNPSDGDGQDVEVYAEAWPSIFYTLKVLPGLTSIKHPLKGYSVGFGSGGELVRQIAVSISEGMIVFHSESEATK